MSIFEKLFSNKKKSYDKYGNLLKTLLTTKEQRTEAIELLKTLPAEVATPELLKRFEIVVDSGLQDSREKEQCVEIIVGFGEKVKPLIKEAIETKRRISWLVKIAEKIFTHGEYVQLILDNLNPEIAAFDDSSIEKTEEMLLALKDINIKDNKVVEKVSQFLSLRDENIRMAALECLEEQASSNLKAKELILNFAKEEVTDANSRFLGVVQSIIQKHRWR